MRTHIAAAFHVHPDCARRCVVLCDTNDQIVSYTEALQDSLSAGVKLALVFYHDIHSAILGEF